MEMEELRKRIRKLIFLGSGIVFLQVMIGTISVTIGILYREFDRARVYEMMDIIKTPIPETGGKSLPLPDGEGLRLTHCPRW